jgi:hypothetical protein
MPRRHVVCAGVGAVLLGGSLSVLYFLSRIDAKPAWFSQVQPGMVQAEVEDLAGGPADEDTRLPARRLRLAWRLKPDQYGQVWQRGEWLLRVSFDADGRVCEICESELRPETWLRGTARRFGVRLPL